MTTQRSTTGNRHLAKKRFHWLIEALCFVSSSVLADNLVLRNPLLRQAPKVSNNAMTKTLSSFRKVVFFTILIGLFLNSCVTKKHLFNKAIFSDLHQLKINTAIAFEKKNKSKDITPSYFIDIGESIYPNKNNYKLEIAKTIKRKEKPGFELEVDYYYVIEDSSVKVILYQWDKLKTKKANIFEDDKTKPSVLSNFQTKFNQLSDSLTKQLGDPFHKNIEQSISADETFRDEIKWKGQNGLNAYLFMLGNNSNGYRQIRLSIYKD